MATVLPEIEHYLDSLDHLRAEVAALIRNVPVEGLNWRPSLPDGADPTNSLSVLAVHLAGSEHFWIAECIGKFPATRDRAAEFKYVASSAKEPLARLGKSAEETGGVLSKLPAADLEGSFTRDGHIRTVRWTILHVISHYSLHVGHMELTYQLWNNGKAIDR